MKTAILLYLYHTDLWEEYKNLLLKNCSNYDLFLGLCCEKNNDVVIDDCLKNFKDCNIQVFENKGVDVGPFLKQLEILDEEKYPFFLKLHSKKSFIKNLNWRVNLVDSLIGSEFTYLKNINLIKKNNVGCVFNTSFLNKNQINLTFKIKEILKKLNLSYEELSNSNYMMGNIFLSKTKIFKKYYTPDFISYVYEKLEKHQQIPEEGSYNHAMEVVNGYIIKNENLSIDDGIVKTKIIYNSNSKNNKIHLVNLYNGECTTKENVKIRGEIKENNNIFWKNSNIVQEYIYLSENKLVKKHNNFDPVLYKLLNNLKDVEISGAQDHYESLGKEQGKITKEDIKNVFDEKYYKNLYGIKEKNYQQILQDYIIKGMPGGRLYNPLIVEDNFDYGFYQSYHNDKKYNQYTSLYDYIKTKRKCNNKINYSTNKFEINSICIYSCDIKSHKDFYNLKTNIELLSKDFNEIFIIQNLKSININIKNVNILTSNIYGDYQKYLYCLNKINVEKYNCVCLINDTNIFINSLTNFLQKFLQSECCLYSMTDSYRDSYHLNDNVVVFNGKNKNIITESLSIGDKTKLSKNLIDKGFSIGSFFQINQEKELFWRNLFLNIDNYPSVLISNNSPCVKKDKINYLLNLIPKNYTKSKKIGKIQSFFQENLDNDNIKKTFNVDCDNLKFCLILHIMDINKYDEYKDFINLLKSKIKLDIYITTNTPKRKGFIKNKGMDIGPFIKTIDKINKNYDYIIKLHGKNLRSFRNLCFNNIINNIYHHVLLLEKNDKLFCSGPNIYNIKLDDLNTSKIGEFLFRNNIKIEKNTENNFFAGTMFIAKYKYVKDFINKINVEEEYSILEEGSVINGEGTNTHAWERILTNIIPNYYGMKNCSI